MDALSAPLQTELLLRFGLAALLGAVLGWDRQLGQHPAGLRVHVLVALGTAVFTVAGVYGVAGLGTVQDAGRVAAQVVVGVGFLGAGTIWRSRDDRVIYGLTTAASIWLTAGLGMLTASGSTSWPSAGPSWAWPSWGREAARAGRPGAAPPGAAGATAPPATADLRGPARGRRHDGRDAACPRRAGPAPASRWGAVPGAALDGAAPSGAGRAGSGCPSGRAGRVQEAGWTEAEAPPRGPRCPAGPGAPGGSPRRLKGLGHRRPAGPARLGRRRPGPPA